MIARAINSTPPSGATSELALVVIGDRTFALPMSAIVAVMDVEQMTVASGTSEPPWIGTLDSRSGTIPVADGRVVFGQSTCAPVGRIIVMRGEPLYALAVDDLTGSLRPGTTDTYRLPELCGSPSLLLLDASVWNDDELLLRIDAAMLSRCLMFPEQSCLESNRDVTRTRLEISTRPSDTVLLVDLSDEQGAIPSHWVRQINERVEYVPVPRTDPHILGLVSWEGRPLTVLDLDSNSRTRTAAVRSGMLVVVGEHHGFNEDRSAPLAALHVPAVIGVAKVSEWLGDAVVLSDGRRVRIPDVNDMLIPSASH